MKKDKGLKDPKPETAEKKPRKTKTEKHSLFVEITPDRYFVTCDGRRIRDCEELADILHQINDDIFKFHVTNEKNDFSTWIHDVFNDEDIAESIRKIHDRTAMRAELYKKLFERLRNSRKK